MPKPGFFYSGLAALLRAGMPVREAVDSMRRDGTLPDPVIATALANGGTLAEALRRAPGKFPAEEIALVEAGEETGRLDAVLDRLAEIHRERDRAAQKFKGSMGYPLVIFHFAAIFMPLGLMTLLSGRLRFAASLSVSVTILVLFWAGVIALWIAARDARVRTRILGAIEAIPALGVPLRHMRRALFATVLEASYESGVTLDRGLRLAAASAGTPAALGVADRVQHGTPLGEAMAGASVLPAQLVGRLSTAERAGELSAELRRISGEEFESADRTLDLAVGVITKGFYIVMVLAIAVYAFFVLGNVYGAIDKL